MQVVLRVGVLMLRSGTIGFRVEQAMKRVALALGADRLDAYITLTGIVITLHQGELHYTQAVRIRWITVDMNRLSAVEFLSQHIPEPASATSLMTILDTIEQTPPVYSVPTLVSTVALACGAFAVLIGGNGMDGVAATIGAGVGQLARVLLHRSHLNPIAITVLCSTLATLICDLALKGWTFIGYPTPTPQLALLASVLFLVPGMALVTAALDLVQFDIISGIARVTYALILMIGVAIGILLAISLTGAPVL